MDIQTHRCPEPSCSFFNQILPHNAKICPMCGTALAQVAQVSRNPAPAPPLPAAAHSHQSSSPSPSERPQLKLIHPSSQSFLLLRESGVIGRQSLANGMRPEIDLTNLPHAGVISRSHAHLYWDRDQQAYMIVDDSRNGSYLNDELLPRGAPHLLSQGDRLQLGQDKLICLQVELNVSVSYQA